MLTNLLNLSSASNDACSGLKVERSGFSAATGAPDKTAAGARVKKHADFLSTLQKASGRRKEPDVSGPADGLPRGKEKYLSAPANGRPAKQAPDKTAATQAGSHQKPHRTAGATESASTGSSLKLSGCEGSHAAEPIRQPADSAGAVRDAGAPAGLSDDAFSGKEVQPDDWFSEIAGLLKVLAAMGFTVSEQGQVQPSDAADLQNNPLTQPEPGLDVPALKRLMAGLQKAGFRPSGEAEAAWKGLQELMCGAGDSSMAQGQGADATKPPAGLQTLIKEMFVQAAALRNAAAGRPVGDAEGARPGAQPALETAPAAGPLKNAVDGGGNLFPRQVETAVELQKTEPGQPSEKAAGVRLTGPGGGGESAADSMARNDGQAAGDGPGSKPSLPAARTAAATVAAHGAHSNFGDPGAEQAGGKISGVDGSPAETGSQSFSQPGFEKSAELVKPPEPPETGRNNLRASPMEQIVKKAVFHLKNGQTEAKIELKPEYLGHIRMQVITEHQQVTIKIHAQLQFVKEMIENNLHQLKAELQQQGLNADKLEVSVSNDSRGHEQAGERPGWLKAERGDRRETAVETDRPEVPPVSGRASMPRASGKAASIDYFV